MVVKDLAVKELVMTVKRPFLVAGVGLTGAFWLLNTMQHSMGEMLGLVTLGGLAATVALRVWSRSSPLTIAAPAVAMNRAMAEQALADLQSTLQSFQSEMGDRPEFQTRLPQLVAQQQQLSQDLDRQALTVAVVGGKGSGKTALLSHLQSTWLPQQTSSLTLQDTASLFAAAAVDRSGFPEADLVLFVTTGDLTDSEWQVLQQMAAVNQRLVLLLNKQDQYSPADRVILLQQLQERTQTILQPEDVVAITANPNPIKVRRQQPDGAWVEQWERPAPELATLTDRLTHIVNQEGQSLVWAATWRGAQHLRRDIQSLINQIRREQATPVIEQYQWIAAATAFATPIAALDLFATTAINAQLVVDLGAIYQQKFTVKQAQVVAGALASLLFKLGLVELSTQMVGAVLKGHLATYVAGGALQGASAAYLTRLAGLTLVEFFQEQSLAGQPDSSLTLEILPQKLRDYLGQKLQAVFQQQRQLLSLQAFVTQAIEQVTHRTPQLSAALGESLPELVSQPGMVEETPSLTQPA